MADKRNTVLVVGATGMIGSAAIRHFAAAPNWEVIGVSRRYPELLRLDPELASRVKHLSVDLTDRARCDEVFSGLTGITAVVYAAVYEEADLVEGWQAPNQMNTNLQMLKNCLEPLQSASPDLDHVALLQGAKAYGLHIHWPNEWYSTPARESEPRHPHDNFYWLQEDYLREQQIGKDWHWTIWRPNIVYGDPIGTNLNTFAPIIAYAVLEREAGRALSYPGGPAYVHDAADVDLIAEAIAWGTTAATARNETFNIVNGDVMVWQNIWPIIAEELGAEVGVPKQKLLGDELPSREDEWANLVGKYDLVSPEKLSDYISGACGLADWVLATGVPHSPPPSILSTIKLREAGFTGCMDTAQMFRKWIRRLEQQRYIPSRDAYEPIDGDLN